MAAKKVLIVEDYASNADMIAAALLEADFDTCVLSTAEGFLESVEIFIPDLIILDIKLPDGDGRELCNSLYTHSEFVHIPVIMVSALLEASFHDVPCSAKAFITKPFDIDELIIKARELTFTATN